MKDVLKFRTDERGAGVCGVDMQPQRVSLTDASQLVYVVKRTDGRRAECRTHLHRSRALAFAAAQVLRTKVVL